MFYLSHLQYKYDKSQASDRSLTQEWKAVSSSQPLARRVCKSR
ncbi:hypothetical protein QUB80_33810 [Chlorogloeopsis sp. ULAP01]|nr:hypothetical protein [Chlorogloeopsis sp. ULAP01]MDM9385634.1 hypothetical protein [Chlorogloeopsis sp. ULAP01]